MLVLPILFSAFLAFAADLSPESVIALTNTEREKRGLAPLVQNDALHRAAELKAADMIKNDYFAHTSPEGLAPWHWIKASGYEYQYAGENLAVNFDSAEEQLSAWMNSKTHRENILNEKYTEIGIAVVRGEVKGKTSFVTVVLFGTPAVVPVAKKPEASKNIFASVPTVKGVETEVAHGSLQKLFVPLVQVKNLFQSLQNFLRENKSAIFQNAEVASWLLVLMSVSAPAALFTYLGLKEIFPRSHQPSPI